MSNHNHSCKCEHTDVKFCKHCNTVYCAGCNQEWTAKASWNWYYNSSTPYLTTTLGQNPHQTSGYIQQLKTNAAEDYITKSHKHE